MTSNLTLCLASKVGYYENKSLKYVKSVNWSIEFYFDIEFMHASDLFLILFSYIKNTELYCLDVYTISKSNKSVKIFSRISAYDINRMNYREFESWWWERQWYDSHLLEPKEIYGIRLSFVPDLVKNYLIENNISLEIFQLSLKPSYPWSQELINLFDYYIDPFNEDTFWDKPNQHKWYNKEKPIKTHKYDK